MAESAERSVIFRMTAEADKRALPNLEKFGKSIERIQVKALDTVDKRRQASMDVLARMSKASVDLERKAHKEISAMINARIALRQKELGLEGRSGTGAKSAPGTGKRVPAGAPRGDDLTKRLREEEKAREKAAKEFEKNLAREQKESEKASKEAAKRFQREINERIKLRDKEAKEADRLRQQQEREDARVHSRHRKRQQQRAAENRKAREKETQEAIRSAQQEAKAEEQIRKQQEKEAERIHKRHRQRQRSIALQNRKSRQAEAREAQQALRATEQQMSQATGRMAAANGLLVEGISSAGESAVRLATGLAQIGIVSESNTEKLLRQVVVLRSISDVVAGSLNLWHRSTKIVQGYNETLTAVKATQQAIAAQQALGGATARGAAGGAAGGAGSRLAGNLASGAAGGATAQATVLQRAALAIGRVGSAAGAVIGPLSKAGGILAGLAATADMIVSLGKTGSIDPRQGSIRGGVATGLGEASAGIGGFAAKALPDFMLKGLADVRGNALDSFTGGAGSVAKAELDRRKSGEMASDREFRLQFAKERRDRRLSLTSEKLESAEVEGNVRVQPFLSRVDETRGDDQLQAIEAAQRELRKQQATMRGVDVSGSAEMRGEQLEKLIEIDDKMVALADKRKEAETKILEAKKEGAIVAIDSSRKELENAKETLATTQDRIKTIKDSLLTAEVKFALKSEREQKKFLDAAAKANAGGQLNRKEMELLLSDAIGKPRDVAEQQAIEVAKAAGIRAVQGADLRAELQREEAKANRLKAVAEKAKQEIEVQQELKVTFEEDIEALADQVAKEVVERNKRFQQMVVNRVAVLEEQRARANVVRRAGASN